MAMTNTNIDNEAALVIGFDPGCKSGDRTVIIQQYTLRIPKQLYKEVKLKLLKENRKLSPVLLEMLQDYIKT